MDTAASFLCGAEGCGAKTNHRIISEGTFGFIQYSDKDALIYAIMLSIFQTSFEIYDSEEL